MGPDLDWATCQWPYAVISQEVTAEDLIALSGYHVYPGPVDIDVKSNHYDKSMNIGKNKKNVT